MKDQFRTKVSFEKGFREAVHNFDETKIWFTYHRNNPCVCFVLDGKLKKFPMYMSRHSLELYKNHFISFLHTGFFDYNAYWQLYETKDINANDVGKTYIFPMHESSYNQFDAHSKEMSDFLTQYRIKYPNCGIKQVPKTLQ